jgi:hypothetical protein
MSALQSLDRKRASRIVARQLSALGRPPDLFLDEAVSALFESSQGSTTRLRALLASTLFLASTEEAPSIGAELVQRAAESLEPFHPPVPLGDELVAERVTWRRNAALLAGGLGMAAIVAAFLAYSVERRPPRKAAPAPPAQPLRQTVAILQKTPGQTLAEVKTPAHRPAVVAPPAPLQALPEGPVPEVVIRYTLGDPAAAARVEAIGSRLRGQKIHPAYSLAGRGQISQPSVDYYFVEDAGLARRIAAAAGGDMVPRLKSPSEGTNLRQPGTIEIAIP